MMFHIGGIWSTYAHRLLKYVLLFSVLFAITFIAVSYHILGRHVNNPKVSISTYDEATNKTTTMSANRGEAAYTATEYINTVVNRNSTPKTELIRRRRLVEDVCTSISNVRGNVQGIFTHKKSGVIYCFVPKTGCTFWKRIFNFMDDQMSNNSNKNLFEISRIDIHTRNNPFGDTYNRLEHRPDNYPIRFIVTRDPISRLIASYLDKMYLPDFWRSIGITFMSLARGLQNNKEYMKMQFDKSNIFTNKNKFSFLGHFGSNIKKMMNISNNAFHKPKEDFLRKHFDDMAVTLNPSLNIKLVSTSDIASCGKYVTFSDFVTGSLYHNEAHWTPVSDLCNPCQFLPTHIGRMETFNDDARTVLSQMGLEQILDGFDSVQQVNAELRMITDYHFTLAFKGDNRGFYNSCLTTKELALRLWNTFQWQGYIHPVVEYKFPAFTDVDEVKTDLMSQIWIARYVGLRDPEAMKLMKKEFASKLVSSLPDNVVDELMWKFRFDYYMFGYKKIKRDA